MHLNNHIKFLELFHSFQSRNDEIRSILIIRTSTICEESA